MKFGFMSTYACHLVLYLTATLRLWGCLKAIQKFSFSFEIKYDYGAAVWSKIPVMREVTAIIPVCPNHRTTTAVQQNSIRNTLFLEFLRQVEDAADIVDNDECIVFDPDTGMIPFHIRSGYLNLILFFFR